MNVHLLMRVSACFCMLQAAVVCADPVDFRRDVRPILADKCFRCHGPDVHDRKAGLRLDDEDSAKAERKGRRPIAPGDPEKSELIRRITASDAAERMPPAKTGKTLSEDEIDVLRRWIQEGASWAAHWAYEMPIRGELPAIKDTAWPINWIDNFIRARLERTGVRPSPEAERITLARRLHFDLTGLPPPPGDVDSFVGDGEAHAYERMVDRLLASEAFGERMAAWWLDLVRYADTVGYHGDQEHHISPYRDYVIDAFNDNLPFDRFTREQLAGDLVPDATIDQQIATGYNRLLQTSHEGGVQPKEYLAIYAADRVRNFSAVWMGGTLGCAQCHDHKFDPYTAKDFYSMVAFFADIDEEEHLRKGSDQSPTIRKPEVAVLSRRERQLVNSLDRDIQKTREQMEALVSNSGEAKPTDHAGPSAVVARREGKDSGAGPHLDLLKARLSELERQRDEIQKSARLTMITKPIEPRTIRIFPRGNWLDDSGQIVEPAVPEFLPPLRVDGRRATRLDLAHWLTDSRNGVGLLTSRVFVNRLWSLFFGDGISRSLEDFGAQGEPPIFPELLDRLAHEFVESGWDIKHMVRLLVTSRTYRQVSVVEPSGLAQDPDNRLWARQSQWRLPAESVRDTALVVSGLLVRSVGGPSARPYQPEDYYQHLNFPPRKYVVHTDTNQWRRGVYVHWQRQYLHPMFKAFDAPSREECTAQRPQSTTPLASLVLLNDTTFVEAARVFAARVMREADSPATRVDYAFRLALSRGPDEFERRSIEALRAASSARFDREPEMARKLIGSGMAPGDAELDPIDHAAWTMVARAILNLNETYLRN